MINRPKLSSILPAQVPEFVREDYTTFIEFLKAYYEFIDQNYDPQFAKLRDLDTTLDSFVEYFKNELAHNIPYTVVNERFLLERMKDQYLAKGSEASFKLLFKLLFNKDVVVDYPAKQILRASDGKWNQDVSIFAYVNAGDPEDIVGRMIDVVTPNKILRIQVDKRQYVEIEVDNVVQISEHIYEFFIDRRFFGTVSVGDKLRYSNTFEATIVPTTSKIEIQRSGKKFKLGELYSIVNGAGNGSIIKVSRINQLTGGIEALEFVKYGVGYSNDFTSTLIPYGGTSINSTAGATGLVIAGVSPSYSVNFAETTNGFFEQGTINRSDYTSQIYWDGTYVGETVREFYSDNKYQVLDADEPAVIKITLGSIAKYPGYYTTNDGFLDDAIFIQDSRYYQAFAYVIKIDERLDKYRSAVKTLIHPAGMALFGEFDIRNEFDTATSLEFALKYLFISLQDELRVNIDYATILLSKPLTDSFSTADSTTNLVGKVVNSTYLNNGSTLDTNSVTLSDSLTTRNFSKTLGSVYLNNGSTLDTNIATPTDSINYFDIGKVLADTSTPTDLINYFDITKALEESTIPTDVYVSLLSKPLGTQTLNDGTTSDVNTVTPSDSNTLLFSKPLIDSLTTPTDSISSIATSKPLTDTLTTPSDSISSIDLSKAFQTHLLYDNITSDTNLVTITDTTGAGSLRTVPYIVLNKFITNTTTNFNGSLDDETVTMTSSGTLWLNPYTAPYPATSSYFLNDSGNYAAGESAFTA